MASTDPSMHDGDRAVTSQPQRDAPLENALKSPKEVAQRCQTLLSLSCLEQAATLYRRLIETHPHLAAGYDGLAQVLFRQGMYAAALETCDVSLSLFPDRPYTVLRRCLALDRLKRHAEVTATVESYLARKGFRSWPYLSIACLRERSVPVQMLILYCQLRMRQEGGMSLLAFYDDLVNYAQEGAQIDGLFGVGAEVIPWFGNEMHFHGAVEAPDE
ncbi:MAG: hypothetical protein HQK87_00845 [Nitrospinae bacterium]|nr:hypothetical protein [Nitrospinota bacterium]